MRKDAERFASVLNRARAIVRDERFHHWQVAFPGVWSQWEEPALQGGFHAVIGNPPYVRQELIKEIKPALKRGFPATYDGSADLYVYFYEQGLTLLRPGGRLSYVVTNKWMRAGYAEGLREMFADQAWVEFVADFGHAKKFFPDADVFPSVVVVRKPTAGSPPEVSDVCVMPRDDVPEKGLHEAVLATTYSQQRRLFTKESWTLEPPAEAALLEKLRRSGLPLAEFSRNTAYRGILTGLNEAYLIDGATKDRLVAEDPRAAEIIKPYLRGQDIRRWISPPSGQFMILLKSSADHEWPWSKLSTEADAEACFRETYPGVYARMKTHEDYTDTKGKVRGLRHREDQGRCWWELRPCGYYDLFSKPKISYQAIQFHPRYSFESSEAYGNNKTFAFESDDLALLAVLNSPLLWWFSWRHFIHLKDEALSNDQVKIATLPIADFARQREEIDTAVRTIIIKTRDMRHLDSTVRDWLRLEFGVEKPKAVLSSPSALDADAFISAVRASLPKRRALSVADVGRLQREHSTSVEPSRLARTDVFTLERRVSEAVNAAYGITPEETQLMWRSAPPRMPFTPAGLSEADEEPDEETPDEEG
ncbi:MAG: Eco57I restriction-modification methylase domain-containing protein [Hyphomonadaceae bacterium JAD_PAG50586_4]|nr:MAG: Eco57I restriction-modification methylase domain-containing protein [Hyphomonadaceae bacterium JAD_PAG50586_4]